MVPELRCEDGGGRGVVYEEDIAKINEWFDHHTEYYGTYHSDECYSVDEYDMESFKDLLRQEFPDLIGIRCYVGTGDSAIWFFEKDLKDARFY